MAPESSRRRQRSDYDEEDDDTNPDNDQSSQSPEPSKRPRLDDSDAPDGLDTSDNDSDSPAPSGLVNDIKTVHTSDMEGFQPGSILRVSVKNFVTYEAADFFPGPNLNMVIGPNGTGKSSLVCAICIGLGYGTKHLGRAKQVKEYVKDGKDMATIEIELKRLPDDPTNYIIRVQVKRETNSQKWWLNGREVNHSAIKKLMGNLKIQVDNLCQFLPQERVVEFAGYLPIDLLHETLRAAAHERMLRWQDDLKVLHKDQKQIGQTIQSETEKLGNLESRQQGLQADVDRFHERDAVIKKVEDLKAARIIKEYDEIRLAAKHAKISKQQAMKHKRRLEHESKPSMQAIARKEGYKTSVETAMRGRKSALEVATRDADCLLRESDKAAEDAKQLFTLMESEEKSFHSKKTELARTRQKITGLEARLKQAPPSFDIGEWNTKIVSLTVSIQGWNDFDGRLTSRSCREMRSTSYVKYTKTNSPSMPSGVG